MKKERYLIQLLDLIKVLKGPELDVARKHVQAYESNHTVNRRKMFQLYKYIKINKIEDYAKLKKRVSPDSTDDSFNKLIRRTTDRIQESLIVDVNIRRKGGHAEIPRTRLLLRKMLMQGQILMTRGMKDRPISIFNTVIRIGRTYELYDELIEAYSYNQILFYNSGGIKSYKEFDLKIDFYDKCRKGLFEATRVHRHFQAVILSSSNKIKLNKSQVAQIEKLKEIYKTTSSSNVLSYYLLIKIEIAKLNYQLDEAYDLTYKLLNTIRNSKAVYSSNRISFLYAELSKVSLVRLELEKSLMQITNGIEFRLREDLTGYAFLISKASVCCLMSDFSKAKEILESVENAKMVKKFSIVSSKTKYLQAISSFGLMQYNEAKVILSQKNEIEKDKEGWNVWIRIMRLLCSIEMLKLNMIDYDIESFRKYLERTSKQYDVRERDKLVLRVLLELDRQDYDFKQTAIEVTDELEKLKSTDKKYAWSPDSPELILFHDWFEAKRLNKDYEPNFEVYREAMKSEQNSDESIP